VKRRAADTTDGAVTIVTLAVGAVLIVGGLWPGDRHAQIEARLAVWFDILAAFAFITGARALVGRHVAKISDREDGWRYSALTVAAFVATLCAGLFKLGAPSWETPLSDRSTWLRGVTVAVYAPVLGALACLAAFALVFALFRAARRRARSLWPMLACAGCAAAANVSHVLPPPGADPSPAPARAIAGTIYVALTAIGTGAQRALMIGIAIGAVALSLRVLLRIDRAP